MPGHAIGTWPGVPRPKNFENDSASSRARPSATSARARCSRVGTAAPAQTLADLGEAFAAQRAHLGEVRLEGGRRGIDAETEHMQRQAVPARRDLDPGHEAQARGRTGRGRLVAACRGVVVGERRRADAAPGREAHQGGRRQQAVRMMAVQVQVGDGGAGAAAGTDGAFCMGL
jgi:hypothetical protein